MAEGQVYPPGPPPDAELPRQPVGVPWPTSGWPERAPIPEVDNVRLEALLDRAFPDPEDAPLGMSLAVVIVHRGAVVAERYGPTAGPDEALISWSMAKSFTQALVGVLVGDGRLGLEDRVVPEWTREGDPRSSITLDQLLRMVPGTVFSEDYVDEDTSDCIDMLFGQGNADMAAYTAALPLLHPAGSVFNYSSGTTNLITRAMGAVVGTGDDFEAWTHDVLFDRLGMGSARLTFDDAGTWVGSSFLHATARDLAKFGLLYLRDGVWEGRRVLPEGWVDAARTLRARDADGNGYGSHWWIWDENRGSFAAKGFETQRIIVDPTSDLVVVRLGKTPAELRPAVDAWLNDLLECFPDR